MRAAVFYDVKDIRLEDVPEPAIGDEDVLVEVTACGICGSDLEYYMGRSPVGTADGKGPLILGHEFAGRVRRARQGRARACEEGDRVAVNPIQSSSAGDFSRSGNPHFDLSVVLGVTTERRLREVRAHEGRARLQAARLDERRAGRVRRDARGVAERGREGADPARRSRRDLRPRAGRALDGAAREGERRARGHRRHARLPPRARARHGRRPRVQHRARRDRSTTRPISRRPSARSTRAISPSARSSQRPPRARRRERSTSPGTARRSSTWASPAPTTSSSCRCSSSLAMDKTIRFSWLYPNQWPNTIRLLREGIVDTSKIITHSIAPRRHRRGHPAGRRARRRRHQDHREAVGGSDGQAEVLRVRDHDVPPDLRRGPRELRRGGRRRGSGIWEFKIAEPATTPRASPS